MRLATLLIAAFLSLVSTQAEPSSQPDQALIRLWIEQLANLSPPRKHDSDVGSDTLTEKEQMDLLLVRDAYRMLAKHFVVVLPQLVDHLADKRYSFPREHPSSGFYENQSVGDACQAIIDAKLLPRNPIMMSLGDKAVWHNLPVTRKWFERVRKMSLFEMQIDSLDWLLRQPPPSGVDNTEWQTRLTEVRKFRDELKTYGKPSDKELSLPVQGK